MNYTKVKISYPLNESEVKSGIEKYVETRLGELEDLRKMAPPQVAFQVGKRMQYLERDMREAEHELKTPPLTRLQRKLDFWIEAEMREPWDEFSILNYLTKMQVAINEGTPDKAWRLLAQGDPHGFFNILSMKFDSPFWLDVQIEPLMN